MSLKQSLKLKTPTEYQYAGYLGGFVNLKSPDSEELVRFKPTNAKLPFNILQKVRVVNAEIVRSDVNDRGGINSGMKKGEIVPAESDKKSDWADKDSGRLHVTIADGREVYEIPDADYLPNDDFLFLEASVGSSQENERLRNAFVRNGNKRDEAVNTYPDDVLKVRVASESTGETLNVDLPLALRDQVNSQFAFGNPVAFDNLTIRFFSPSQNEYSHILHADNLVARDNKNAQKQAPKTDAKPADNKSEAK